jgi:hypothetical protein
MGLCTSRLRIQGPRKADTVDLPTARRPADVVMMISLHTAKSKTANPRVLRRSDVWRPGCSSVRGCVFASQTKLTFPIGPGMRVNQEDCIRARNTANVLIVTISIAMTQGLSHAQAPAPREAMSPSSTITHAGSGETRSKSIDQPSDQRATRPCRLQVQDTFVQPPANATGPTAKIETLDYIPLSARCKFNLFVEQTHSPYTFVSAGFQATLDQAEGQWPHYGGGMQGWAKRFGATLADTESRRFIQTFALSTILHQDPRYFPSHKRAFIARTWYSTTRVVVTRNDNGNSTFNTSEFLGALTTSSLQNAYYPRPDRTFGDTMNRFSGALISDAIDDLQREFTPDMKRLFRKHAPKKILKIEEKLPIPAEDKP